MRALVLALAAALDVQVLAQAHVGERRRCSPRARRRHLLRRRQLVDLSSDAEALRGAGRDVGRLSKNVAGGVAPASALSHAPRLRCATARRRCSSSAARGRVLVEVIVLGDPVVPTYITQPCDYHNRCKEDFCNPAGEHGRASMVWRKHGRSARMSSLRDAG